MIGMRTKTKQKKRLQERCLVIRSIQLPKLMVTWRVNAASLPTENGPISVRICMIQSTNGRCELERNLVKSTLGKSDKTAGKSLVLLVISLHFF